MTSSSPTNFYILPLSKRGSAPAGPPFLRLGGIWCRPVHPGSPKPVTTLPQSAALPLPAPSQREPIDYLSLGGVKRLLRSVRTPGRPKMVAQGSLVCICCCYAGCCLERRRPLRGSWLAREGQTEGEFSWFWGSWSNDTNAARWGNYCSAGKNLGGRRAAGEILMKF
jgi:hypothetical protein